MSRRNWLLFAAMCVIWGVPYLMIRVAVREVSPPTLVFFRTALGALLLLPIAIRRDALRPVLRCKWQWLLVYSAVEVAAPWLMLSDAETKLSSSLTGLLVAAVPLVGVAIARLQGTDDRVDGWRGFGLLLGIGGVVALLGLDVGEVHVGPLIEVAITVVCYAVGPVIISRQLSDVPVMGVVVLSLAVTAVGYAPAAALNMPTSLPANVVWSVIGLATICTALAFIVFFALISGIGPARATVITYVNPAVAVLLGVALLGEKFTVGMAVGFPLILLGSVLAARKREVRVDGSASAPTPLAEPAPS
jgi:drug/metabolite transporter (DMT)-like permease